MEQTTSGPVTEQGLLTRNTALLQESFPRSLQRFTLQMSNVEVASDFETQIPQSLCRAESVCRWAMLLLFMASTHAIAQNGRTSAGSSPTLDEGNGSQISGAFMPKWRRLAEERGVKLVLQDTYVFQGNPKGGRTQTGAVVFRTNGTLTLDLFRFAGLPGATFFVSGLFKTGSNLATDYVGAWDLASSIAGSARFAKCSACCGFPRMQDRGLGQCASGCL